MGVVRGLYLKDFEPVVQPDEFIETFPKKKYYVVGMVYTLPLLSVNICDSDHLNANLTTTESAEDQLDDVYVDADEIAHIRMVPRDDFAITWLAKPKARPYMTTKNKTWVLQTVLDDPRTNPASEHLQLHELFQFEDTEMWYKAKSNTSTLSSAYLEFFGYRLIVNEVKLSDIPKGIKPTKIPTEGYPGTSS